MNNNDLLKTKRQAEAEKKKDKFCTEMKKLFTDNKVSISRLSGKTYIDGKNICDILNCKGDPQMSTVLNILSAEKYTVRIVTEE